MNSELQAPALGTEASSAGAELEARIDHIIAGGAGGPGALLPLLHALQDALGYIPPTAVPRLARALDLSRAEVAGVISYYRHFRSAPPAPQRVRLCRAEACQAVGAEALFEHARARLAERDDIALEAVYCLGLCACGPALQVNESRQYGRVTTERFDCLLASLTPSGEPKR